MKKMLLLTILGISVTAAWYNNQIGMDTIYPETGYVTELNYETDEVIYQTFSGNEFSFYGIEDWTEGDIVSLVMFNNFTKGSVYDDVILNVKYSGWVY